MRAIHCCLVLCLLGCGAADGPPEPAAFNRAAVEAAARAAFEEYVERTDAGDWEAALALYSDAPDFHWVEDGSVAYPSKADLAAAIEGVYGAVSEISLAVDDVRVLPLSGEHAWLTATWQQTLTFTSGESFAYAGVTTILMAREGDGWVFLAGHNSTPKPRGG